jgi:hypothetical protein
MANQYLAIGSSLGEDTLLRRRLAVAIMKARADIINESVGTTNHANRLTWANLCATVPQVFAMADKMIVDVLGNATIFANPDQNGVADPDGDVQFVVNSLLGVAGNVAVYST